MGKMVKRKIKVIKAEYVEEACSILIVGECEEGRLRTQIHRECFAYGDRSEQDIKEELDKTAEMMVGKTIEMEFDPDLHEKTDK